MTPMWHLLLPQQLFPRGREEITEKARLLQKMDANKP